MADWEPPPISDDDRRAGIRLLQWHADVGLKPGDPLLIAGRIHSLLAHWRDREDWDEPTRTAVAEDWMRVMKRYPLWAVHEAAAEWIEANRFRPTVADIRLLCDRAVRTGQQQERVLRRLLRMGQRPSSLAMVSGPAAECSD